MALENLLTAKKDNINIEITEDIEDINHRIGKIFKKITNKYFIISVSTIYILIDCIPDFCGIPRRWRCTKCRRGTSTINSICNN